MKKAVFKLNILLGIFCSVWLSSANSTLVGFSNCVGANDCQITTTPPNPVAPNPNDGILLAWDEVQNYTLTQDLQVDRVFDETASFIDSDGSGGFIIQTGTVISSHYLQWDPGNGSELLVEATVDLDSQIFAFITNTGKLSDSDFIGLPGLDYNDFGLRGLEGTDTTNFNGNSVDIRWSAQSPGDWTRLITAFSPGGSNGGVNNIPEPEILFLFGLGLLAINFARRQSIAFK